MHDEADVLAPDGFRNGPAQVGRQDQVGLEQVHRLGGDAVVDVELDGDFVT
jgi:hypothetical protein